MSLNVIVTLVNKISWYIDPAAGSPTATLLRLVLPLDIKPRETSGTLSKLSIPSE